MQTSSPIAVFAMLSTVAALLVPLHGCGDPAAAPVPVPTAPTAMATSAKVCPAQAVLATVAPGTTATHNLLATWTARAGAAANEVLLSPTQIEGINRSSAEVTGGWRSPTSRQAGMPDTVIAGIDDRMNYMTGRIAGAHFVEGSVGAFEGARTVHREGNAVDHERLVVGETQLHCIPLDTGLYKRPIDKDFDRNACASLHPGEHIRVLRRGPRGEWLYVHAGHTVGWIHNAAVTGRLSPEHRDAWNSSQRVLPVRDNMRAENGFVLRLGVSLPLVRREPDAWVVRVPDTEHTMVETRIAVGAATHAGPPELTRTALWGVLFSELDAPYGWGGRNGGRDCSRLLRDAFASFGLQLPRHSAIQARVGSQVFDVAGLGEDAKRDAIASAAKQGVVVLYMRGHIMVYLGREGGQDYAISAISEYLEPCSGGPDTTHKIDRVAVTTLELGRDTERTAFIERIKTLVVFGPKTGPVVPHDPTAL